METERFYRMEKGPGEVLRMPSTQALSLAPIYSLIRNPAIHQERCAQEAERQGPEEAQAQSSRRHHRWKYPLERCCMSAR